MYFRNWQLFALSFVKFHHVCFQTINLIFYHDVMRNNTPEKLKVFKITTVQAASIFVSCLPRACHLFLKHCFYEMMMIINNSGIINLNL